MDWPWIIVLASLIGAVILVKVAELLGKFLIEFLFIFTQIEEDEFPHRPEAPTPNDFDL